TLAVQADGKYVIGGAFNNYNNHFVNNIARLNRDGSMDSTIVKTQTGAEITLPAFNAFFDGGINKIIQTPDSGKLLVIGAFNYFMRIRVVATNDGLRDSLVMDSIRTRGMAM